MANQSNNSKPTEPLDGADSRSPATNSDSNSESKSSESKSNRSGKRRVRIRVRKKIPLKNPETRIRKRTVKYEQLRRSQNRLGWSISLTTFVGIGLGLVFGQVFVGTAAGLIVGLAFGLVIAG